MPHLDDGARAEQLAAAYLQRHGLTVVARNFRCRAGEIDLILRDGATLVFAEVRLRKNGAFGGAAASITPHKQHKLRLAAQYYLQTLPTEPPCRFDALLLDRLDENAVEWVKNVIGG
ncbi:MAG: YraN family protein [Sulfuricellaceae bacterium]